MSAHDKAFQDYYPDDYSQCDGCGRLNQDGLHIKSFWDGEDSVCRFEPKPYHIALPGLVYGGLIASLFDCHGTGTATAVKYHQEKRIMGTDPPIRYVTASLQVDYLAPTPINVPLELRGKATKINDRKVTVSMSLYAEGQKCARGKVVAVKMPENMMKKIK